MVAAQRLQVSTTMNDLARLGILANYVVVIDFMFGDLVTRRGRRPMPVYGCANSLLVDLFDN